MAHSHEQSLLARLGFADPDRKDKRHTLACQYLCEPEVAERVVQAVGYPLLPKVDMPSPVTVHYPVYEEFPGELPYNALDWIIDKALHYDESQSKYGQPKPVASGTLCILPEMEHRITTGRNFLVGFADVVLTAKSGVYVPNLTEKIKKSLPCRVYSTSRNPGPHPNTTGIVPVANLWSWSLQERAQFRLLIEVKVFPTDPADIIKQIETYRSGEQWSSAVCATCYPMTATDKATLKAAGIHHIYLGDGFKAYCAKRAEEKPVEETGI